MLSAHCVTLTMLLLSLTAYRSRAGKSHRATVDYFNSSILNYSSLVFDPYQDVVYLAARNNLLELNLTSMASLNVYESKARKAARELCHSRWKPEGECENFMKIDSVLLNSSSDTVERLRFLVCNSNAYAPFCEIRSALAAGHELYVEENVFPGNPHEVLNNQVSLMSVKPDREHVAVYLAGLIMADWTSIIKAFDEHKITSSTSASWLHNPVFVGMHEEEQYVLIFFREVALEDHSLRKNIVYSRVARICKADQGATSDPESVFLDEKVWTTFVKARLLCTALSKLGMSERASDAVQYNFLQDVHYDPIARHFVTVFLNKEPRVWGVGGRTLDSAVCTFTLRDIEQTFNSPFVHQDSNQNWRLASNADSVICPLVNYNHANSSHLHTTAAASQAVAMYMFQYSSVFGQLNVTLPATFVQQVVTRSVASGNCSKSVTYLLDSHAVLHTMVENAFLSTDQLVQFVHADFGRPQRRKFYEMKLYDRSVPNYLVIISDERVIRVSVSACEGLLTEDDCQAAWHSQCRWSSDASLCLHQQLASDHFPFFVAYAPTPFLNIKALPDELHEFRRQPVFNVFEAFCEKAKAKMLLWHHAVSHCSQKLDQFSCSVHAVWNVSVSHQMNASLFLSPTHVQVNETLVALQNFSIHYYCPPYPVQHRSIISSVRLGIAEPASSSIYLKFLIPFVCFCAGLLFGVITFIILTRRKRAFTVRRHAADASVTPQSRVRSATSPASLHSRLSKYSNPETYRQSLLSARFSLNASIASRSHLSARYLAQSQSTTDTVDNRETNAQDMLIAAATSPATSMRVHY